LVATEIKSWTESGRLHKLASRVIAVPPKVAWRVMSDHAGYAEVADNLSKVEVLSGHGLGMTRRCYDTRGRGWSETCTLWQEGQAYAFAVGTNAADYRYPLRELEGLWRVESVEQGSRVTLEFLARPKWGLFGRLMLRLFVGPAERICLRLLDRWEARMLSEAA
jgi:hypothetical protein